LHGEVRKHNEPFSNGLQYPRDMMMGGRPEELINCRCSWIIESKKEIDEMNISPLN
jgi:hypothetical protein